MGTFEPGGAGTAGRSVGRLPAAAGQAARDRARLRESQSAVASEVIEFQLARQRAGLVTTETIEPLSRREQEVLALLAAGHPDAEIAERLFIAKKTASVHVANIKAKLGASSRVEIALLAVRLGLVDPEAAPADGAAAVPARPTRDIVVCPFKGLASYEPADAAFFFGREQLIAELVARLAGSTFLGVVGPSGSGKSSVIRAGLLPALSDGVLPGSEQWLVGMMRPGATPSAVLTRTLDGVLRHAGVEPDGPDPGAALDRLPDGARLVLVVDQFEELFTVCRDEADREAFLRDLVALARDPGSRALAVVAMRADFYGRCADHRDLADVLGANHVLVGPMTADELARAVALPTRAAGLRIEPELTSALVRDVLDQPGGLPLMSTTLLELWQRREGRTMRLRTYDQIGGVSGAVARLAEVAYGRLTPEQQVAARAVLLRLVAEGEGESVARRPAPLGEFDADDPEIAPVLAVLTESRLLTVSEGSVEIAHESLLREWPRLRRWLEDDAEGRRLRVHLTRSAREWHDAGGDAAELYRGARLAATLEWSEGHVTELNHLERTFLAESRALAELETTRQRRINRRLRLLLAGTAVFLFLAVVAGAVAALQLGRAEDEAARAAVEEERAEAAAGVAEQERDRAEDAARQARSGELVASALATIDDDPSLAKLLALSAASLGTPSIEAIAMLHRSLAADRIVTRRDWDPELFKRLWTELDPSGRLAVVTAQALPPGPNERLEVVELATGRVLWAKEFDANAVVGLGAFTPEGDRVVAGVHNDPLPGAAATPPRGDMGVYVWDAATGDEIAHWDVGPCGAVVSDVSATHGVIGVEEAPDCFTELSEPAREVIDLGSGARTRLADRARWDLRLGAFSDDGRYVAFDSLGGDMGVSIVRELATGAVVAEVEAGSIPGQQHQFVRDLNADGTLLLEGDLPPVVIDIRNGGHVALETPRTGATWFAEFDRSGDIIGIGRDGHLRRWDPASGAVLLDLPAVGNGRMSASRDGLVLVSRDEVQTAVLVDPGGSAELGSIDARARGEYWPDRGLTTECFAVSETLVVAGGLALFSDTCSGGYGEGTTQAVDVGTVGTVASRYALPGVGAQRMAVSPDGTRFVRQEAAGFLYGGIKVRDSASGDEILELEGMCSYENGPNVFPEGVGECRKFPDLPFPIWVTRLRWSPDGSMIAAVSDPYTSWIVAVWSADDGWLLLRQRLDPGDVWDVMFTPDSRHLLVSIAGRPDARLLSVPVATWKPERDVTVPGVDVLDLVGFSADGATLHAATGVLQDGSTLRWLDATTLESTRPPRPRLHEGSLKTIALSPDASRIATGGSDGVARVWDATDGSLVHEILLGEIEVQGVAFVDDDRLAVVARNAVLRVFTLDPAELLRIARDSLTRGYTEAECVRYDFGDICPTLEELRAG